MRKAVLMGVAAAAMVAGGCSRGRAEDGGPATQKTFQVGSFQQIVVGGPYDVDVHTGGNPSVSASGPQKLIDNMSVEVRGDRLVIEPEHHGFFNWGWGTNGSAKVDVTVPSLTAAKIAGSGGITVDKIQGDSFEGAVAGSGDLTLNALQVKQLKLAIAGSGDLRAVSGQAAAAEYTIAGSGDLDARGVQAQAAAAKIMGSGSIKAHATGTADATIMGSGDINISGGAKCTVTKHGSGDISCS
jgi:hypothetical protein